MFLATTRIAVLRGTTESLLGDEVDDNTDAAVVDGLSSVPASLTQRSKSVWDPASQTRRTVRVITVQVLTAARHPETGARVPVVVLDGDRIKDLTTGNVYALRESTGVARNLAGQTSLTLDLIDSSASTTV